MRTHARGFRYGVCCLKCFTRLSFRGLFTLSFRSEPKYITVFVFNSDFICPRDGAGFNDYFYPWAHMYIFGAGRASAYCARRTGGQALRGVKRPVGHDTGMKPDRLAPLPTSEYQDFGLAPFFLLKPTIARIPAKSIAIDEGSGTDSTGSMEVSVRAEYVQAEVPSP